MSKLSVSRALSGAFLFLLCCRSAQAAPLISEFLAVNTTGLQDEDGDFSDWIEIHNPDPVAVDLEGWHLTDRADNLTKWTFPPVSIPPGGYLVVFASEKNRAVGGGSLHTNFKLSGDGEFLALVTPDGLMVGSGFDPFPPQVADIAYGISFTPRSTTVLATGAAGKVHVPDAVTGAALGDDWQLPVFLEGASGELWASAASGLGFGNSYADLIGPGGNLASQLQNLSAGAYTRFQFEIPDLSQIDALTLRMKYDDGFVAYLNGEEVARGNVPGGAGGLAPETGLVALYAFDGDLSDSSSSYTNGSGIAEDDLSPTGNAVFQPGIAGQAVKITAAGLQRLRAPDSNDLDLAPDWTLEAFVKPDSGNTGEWDRFWTKWGDGGNDWHLTFRSTGTVTVNNGIDLFVNGSDNIINSNSTASVPLNVWSHIALVGNQEAGSITAWLNGVQVGSAPWRAVTPTGGAMNFGNFESPANALQYSGLIDEAAIWNVALSPAQIASHAAAISMAPANSAGAYGLTPVGGAGPGGNLGWDSTAAADRPDAAVREFESFDLTPQIDLLSQGSNLLAIHGLNADSASADFLILPELDIAELSAEPGTAGYIAGPTPGAPNLALSANIGPVIGPVDHQPEAPGDDDPIVVTAAIAATLEPVASVNLTYRVGYSAPATLPMRDDGTGADSVTGDGLYSAAIPASSSAPGDMVRWKVTATNAASVSTTAPAFLNPVGSPEYFGTVISDPATTSILPLLHWFVQNTGAAETGSGTRASISFNGEFYDNVFVRIRGDTARSWPKKSWKFDFNDGHHFRFDPALPRVDEININTTYTDKSYLRTVLAYESFRDAGAPYSISFPLRVERNSAFYSVAIMVEQPDRDYLRRNALSAAGALYKAKANSIQGLSSFSGPATSGIQKKNRTDEDSSDLQALINNLALNGDALGGYLFDNVDIPAVINYMATNVVIQNIDRTVKNFYLYRDTEGSGEWMMFPWDVDLSFGPNALNTNTIVTSEDTGNNSSHPFMGTATKPYSGLWNGLLDAMIDRPETRAMFLRRLRTLGDKFLNTTYYEDRIDQLVADLGPDVALDRARWGGSSHFSGSTLPLTGEAGRIRTEYLPGRRTHLFVTHAAASAGAVLVPESSSVTALVPTSATLGDSWQLAGFDDSSWLSGGNAVGYERSATLSYTPLLGIDLLSPSIPAALRIDANGDNINDNNTCYLRYPFSLADRGSVASLKLRVKYDDGFVAFLNGTRVAGRNDPSPLTWNAEASAANPDNLAIVFEDIDISAFKHLLLDGINVLAVQALNNGSTSSDMLFSCELADASSGSGSGVGIPPSQPAAPGIDFGTVEFNPPSGNQDEEFIELRNPNGFAVDVSGWKLAGGISMTLKPGTVIPASGHLFLSPDVRAFRARGTSPTGGERHFVQGSYSGHLSNFGETLTLSDAGGTQISQITTISAPSDAQRYLVITEVMYHPAGEPGEEFIELMNISSSVTLDLNGVQFTAGIAFDFSGSAITSLPPGARVLVVRDLAAFTAAHGAGLPVAGQFADLTSLNNAGETIKLEDAASSTVKEFTYSDKAPWPVSANGLGASLVLIRPLSNPDPAVAAHWRPSAFPGGNPGGLDAVGFTGDPEGDLNHNGIPDLIDHALNGGAADITANDSTVRIEFVRSLAADDVDLTVELSSDLATWSDASALFAPVGTFYPGDGTLPVTIQAERTSLPGGRIFFRLKAATP